MKTLLKSLFLLTFLAIFSTPFLVWAQDDGDQSDQEVSFQTFYDQLGDQGQQTTKGASEEARHWAATDLGGLASCQHACEKEQYQREEKIQYIGDRGRIAHAIEIGDDQCDDL